MNKSKEKGSRFERRVANLFNVVFKGRKLRRTPLSGGHSIKSDIYDPDNDNFPYFIECKYRESYNINTLLNGKSPLYAVFNRTWEEVNKSEFAKKYEQDPIPLVIFKGGHFNVEMVMMDTNDLDERITIKFYPSVIIRYQDINIMPLSEFLKVCSKKPLKLKADFEVLQEDDGDCD